MSNTQINKQWTFNVTPWQKQADRQGGDFYLIHRTTNHTRIFIGDVSGHGEDAAPFANKLRPWIQHHLANHMTVNTLRQWSSKVRRMMPNRFVAFTCIQIDRQNATAEIFAAGNPDLIIRKQDGTTTCLEANGMPLGLVDDHEWVSPQPQEIQIATQDEIVCFTDGLTDTTNKIDERFGFNRVLTSITAATNDCVAAIRSAVRTFAESAIAQDDLTLLRIAPMTRKAA